MPRRSHDDDDDDDGTLRPPPPSPPRSVGDMSRAHSSSSVWRPLRYFSVSFRGARGTFRERETATPRGPLGTTNPPLPIESVPPATQLRGEKNDDRDNKKKNRWKFLRSLKSFFFIPIIIEISKRTFYVKKNNTSETIFAEQRLYNLINLLITQS